MKILIAIILLYTISIINLKGQSKDQGVDKIELKFGIVGKSYPDSIVIRWAPESSNALPAILESGVWIERMISFGKYPYEMGKWQKLTKDPIKPWPIEAFNKEQHKKNDNVMLVAQLLYGKMPTSDVNKTLEASAEQANMLSSLFSMALLGCDYSSIAANSFGLRLKDDIKIKPDEKIFYRVYSAFNHSHFKVDTAYTFVTHGEWGGYNGPKFLTAKSGEKSVELQWNHNKKLERYSGFFIERSKDGKNYEVLNKKPYMTMTSEDDINVVYLDSVVNYIKYFYRVRAIDPFAEFSDFSNVVTSYGRDLTPPDEIILTEQNKKEKGIRLSWRFKENIATPDLKKFIIRKGGSIDNIVEEIATANKTEYQYHHKTPATKNSIYFEVVAIDTAGNERSSNPVRYFIPDNVPPNVVTGFEGSIDTNGIVRLKWNLDTLDELVGYRVYRTNKADHDMVCLQQGYLQSNTFIDTLDLYTLTDEVYYAVCAVDQSYNHGKKTSLLKLIKPDKIAPFPPQIINYLVKDGAVDLEWVHSPSNDVKKYYLIKKDQATSKESRIELEKNTTKYTDKVENTSNIIEYSICAMDKSGLFSTASFPLKIKTYHNTTKEELKLNYFDKPEKTGFSWSKPNSLPLYYIIYRDIGTGWVQYKNVEPTENQFEESKKEVNQKLRYALQAIYENQTKSKLFTLDWKIIN
ncbi:MAG: hypothetical protein RLZZ546_2899 [Bacteroidota bacterium]|jgi:hypothetical protein